MAYGRHPHPAPTTSHGDLHSRRLLPGRQTFIPRSWKHHFFSPTGTVPLEREFLSMVFVKAFTQDGKSVSASAVFVTVTRFFVFLHRNASPKQECLINWRRAVD